VFSLSKGFFKFCRLGNAVLRAEVDKRYAIKRFKPHTEVRWSVGWYVAYRTLKRSNNLGYLNDHDCVPMNNRPTMTTIGDSYVEAMQIRNKYAHHALLHSGLHAKGQVCGIGTSWITILSQLQSLGRRCLKRPSVKKFIWANGLEV